jgi:hypothetical protein
MMNFNQPYGQISGIVEGAPGAKYTQNGKYYNAKGVEIKSDRAAYVEPTPTPIDVVEPTEAVDPLSITSHSDVEQVQQAARQLGISYTTKAETVRAIKSYVQIDLS